MNTNLNNIPLEIYLDYISEQTNQEWTLEHILTNITHSANYSNYKLNYGFGVIYGHGCLYNYLNDTARGCGAIYTYLLFNHAKAEGCIYGHGYDINL